jgi:GH18 family chitinase
MKKGLLSIIAVFCLLAAPLATNAQKILGYYPYYRTTVGNIQYSQYTDIVYAFLEPNWNGTLEIYGGDFDLTEFNTMVSNCALNNVGAHISIGGAFKSDRIAHVAADAGRRAVFIAEIVDFVSGNHASNSTPLAGMDIDWEFPSTSETGNHLALIQELRAALDAQGQNDGRYYELGIAIDGSVPTMPANLANYGTDYFDASVINYVDYAFSMNYDLHYIGYANNHHSPYVAMTQAFDYYVNNLNWPANKILMGIPFYARTTGGTALDGGFKAFASSSSYNDADGVFNGYTYNSKPIIDQKVDYICQNGGGGVLVWEVSHDATAPYSLGQALKDAFDGSCASLQCSQPSLGSDQTFCADPIDLNAGITLQNGESIRWYRDNQLIGGETTVDYTATVSGTYKAEVYTNGGCTKSDEVVLSQGGDLQASASNDGVVCEAEGPTTADITVTGGGGFYNFYDVASGGSPVASGASMTVNASSILEGNSVTYYVEEPAGQVATIGQTAQLTTPDDRWGWLTVGDNANYDNRTKFTMYTDGTLQSIDYYFGYNGDGYNHDLEISIYESDGTTLVWDTIIDLDAGGVIWNTALNTMSLNVALPAGDYQISYLGSTVLLWWEDGNDNVNFPYAVQGVAALTETYYPPQPTWDMSSRYFAGYNWNISTGTGQACGRVPVTIEHTCPTSSEEVVLDNNFSVFPNPAVDQVNIRFNAGNGGNATLEVFNTLGELVSVENISNLSGEAQLVLSTENYDNGVYHVQVTSNGNTYKQSVVITK